MNNVKYYNDSLAYDFEMFMPKKAETAERLDNIVVLPKVAEQQRKRKRAAARSLSAPATLIMAAIFVLAALCGNIGLRIKINEINADIKNVKAAISELESEKTSLEMEMERRISFTNLELEATKLGMKKLEKDKVTYIRVNNKDTARKANGEIVSAE